MTTQSLWERIKEAWQGEAYVLNYGIRKYQFQDIKELVLNPRVDKLLVDVREPQEYSSVHIPGARNIPYRSQPRAWELDEASFRRQYGFKKPPLQGVELIFYCQAGSRALEAADRAEAAGYRNIATYPGSTNDWLANEGYKL
ncbi:rhodanese-like domain-containing protein Ecym_6252 [Eremothecium cymbalariae DBVPG|uniref:Rhodanese domain-containing protein n=1 Tax=Eremothecium cymbalariae (strain CBS 270.75 / DBVPG 7215 / KCTC 17166 / NRRL Y-17582) TaxID=931890 RepID=G8JVF5_ERECY|nr:hypothetical protein Ecym_6252 [Eremothecium cymbalariae DBVPG\